jgi:predicted enzyme related to lactoylglutathione lyase
MQAKISQVILVVKNQAEALDYYTKKVGFEKKNDTTPPGSYRWVTVGALGQDLEIALFQEGTKDSQGYSSRWHPGNNPPITINVDDCKKAFAEMKSRGVKFMKDKPDEYPWGISATFSDPDGNLFSINQRPTSQSWGK